MLGAVNKEHKHCVVGWSVYICLYPNKISMADDLGNTTGDAVGKYCMLGAAYYHSGCRPGCLPHKYLY